MIARPTTCVSAHGLRKCARSLSPDLSPQIQRLAARFRRRSCWGTLSARTSWGPLGYMAVQASSIVIQREEVAITAHGVETAKSQHHMPPQRTKDMFSYVDVKIPLGRSLGDKWVGGATGQEKRTLPSSSSCATTRRTMPTPRCSRSMLYVIRSIPIWSLTSDLAHCFPKLVLSNVLTVAIQLRIRT
jgi:hypothetical protein